MSGNRRFPQGHVGAILGRGEVLWSTSRRQCQKRQVCQRAVPWYFTFIHRKIVLKTGQCFLHANRRISKKIFDTKSFHQKIAIHPLRKNALVPCSFRRSALWQRGGYSVCMTLRHTGQSDAYMKYANYCNDRSVRELMSSITIVPLLFRWNLVLTKLYLLFCFRLICVGGEAAH